MKIARLVIGLLLVVLSCWVFLHSCFAAVGDDLNDNQLVFDSESGSWVSVPKEEEIGKINGGEVGIYISYAMFAAGWIGAFTFRRIIGAYITGGILTACGVCGIVLRGNYKELIYYAIVCLVLAAVYIVGGVLAHREKKAKAEVHTVTVE